MGKEICPGHPLLFTCKGSKEFQATGKEAVSAAVGWVGVMLGAMER